MSTNNIPFSILIKKKRHELSQICSYGLFSKVLKNEFETAVVNEPAVFEPLKFYCIYKFVSLDLIFCQQRHLDDVI